MENDLERLGVGGHDDELRLSTIERLGGLVGALAQLLVVHRLLHEIEHLLRQTSLGQRPRLWVHFFLGLQDAKLSKIV